MACHGLSIPCVNSRFDCLNGGVCCQLLSTGEQYCVCPSHLKGFYCGDLVYLPALSAKDSSKNVLISGIIVGLVALILTAVVVYIVVRMMRRRNVQVVIIEDEGDACSPLITEADYAENRVRDSIVIVRNFSVRNNMRNSSASYGYQSDLREGRVVSMLAPGPSTGLPCLYLKQTSVSQESSQPLSQPCTNEDHTESRQSRDFETLTKL